jgi:hypothetical protein
MFRSVKTGILVKNGKHSDPVVDLHHHAEVVLEADQHLPESDDPVPIPAQSPVVDPATARLAEVRPVAVNLVPQDQSLVPQSAKNQKTENVPGPVPVADLDPGELPQF